MAITIVNFFYLMSLVVWVGSIIFFSFFGAPSIFKILDRETAGDVVGDIFPKYWTIGYICGSIALGAQIFLAKIGAASALIKIILLSVMLVIILCSGLVVGTKARTIKAQMRAAENIEKKEELRKHFMKIHGVSMLMNMTVLILGITVVFFVAHHMKI